MEMFLFVVWILMERLDSGMLWRNQLKEFGRMTNLIIFGNFI
jgi:hypothetical protein